MIKRVRSLIVLFAVLFSLVVSAIPIGSLGGSIGANIRSDGSYLHMTMENGIMPYFNTSGTPFYTPDCTVTLDGNSSIEGKYCLNITSEGNVGDGAFAAEHWFNNAIKPRNMSYKFMIKRIATADYILIRLFGMMWANMITLKIDNVVSPGDITITNFSSTKKFTDMIPFRLNTIYTLTISDIVYRTLSATRSHLYTATLSNATDSQTIYNLQMGKVIPGYGKSIPFRGIAFYGFELEKNNIFYFDDWTIGTQSKIETYAATNVEETTATIDGELFNDGSPLQKGTQSNHTVRFLYDNESHPVNYTYYFNEYNTSTDNENDKLTDSNENTYGKIYNGTEHQILNNDFIGFFDINKQGQVFKIGTNGTDGDLFITGVKVNITKIGNPGLISINITNVTTSGIPGKTIYSKGILLSSSVSAHPTYSWVTIPVTNCTLKYNTSYAFYLNATGSAVNRYDIAISNSASYSGGTYVAYDGSSWTKYATYDTAFRIVGIYKTLLNNNSGNVTSTPVNENITKVELRAKTNLSSDAYNGKILLQPVFNTSLINGSIYNTFAYHSSGDWSDWIDITNDSKAPSDWNWSNITRLKCRVIANLTSGIAYCGMVELRVTVQSNYSFNKTISGLHANTSTTDAFLYNLSGLSPGKIYFYRTYINTSYTNSPSYSYGDEYYFLTKPQNATDPKTKVITAGAFRVNFSWVKGVGANKTVLVSKAASYPTSPSDGTVIYNGTGTYYNTSIVIGSSYFVRAWSYESYNLSGGIHLAHFSDNHTDFNFSVIGFNCFNESKPSQAIIFTIEISSPDGGFTYRKTNCVNTHYVNISEIEAGGTNFYIIVNSTGYRTRSRYEIIYDNTLLNMSFYLPPIVTGGGYDETENTTHLYQITVINKNNNPIQDTSVIVKRYINTTESYETVGALVTDGSGQCTIWLRSGILYKFFLSADGYENQTANWITDTLIYTKTFVMEYASLIPPPTLLFNEEVRFNGTIDRTASTLTLYYYDRTGDTINTTIILYESIPGALTNTLFATDSKTANSDYSYSHVINNSRIYRAVIYINHTVFGYCIVERLFEANASSLVPSFPITTPTRFNLLFTLNYGICPFGWSNVAMWIIALGVLFSFGRRDTYMSAILLGFVFLFINYYIGFNTLFAIGAGIGFPVLFIAIGILMLYRDRGYILQ